MHRLLCSDDLKIAFEFTKWRLFGEFVLTESALRNEVDVI